MVAGEPNDASGDRSEQPTISTTPVTQPPSDPTPELPDRIGRYNIVREIDRGAMGVVLSGYDSDLERRVAIKVVKIHAVHDPGEHQARMLREARAIARVRHPNVVHVYEVGEYDDGLFIAMELVEGDNLRHWQRSDRTLPEILAVYRQAGLGLAAAHAAGLVHRDFKPANALVGHDGRVCVLDFGLAREGEHPGSPTHANQPVDVDSQLTAVGVIVGTPAYMSPEQLVGDPLDARSDQFSFCVALWEAVAGQRPFRAETLKELQRAIAAQQPADPENKLPPWLRTVLARGLSADRDARFTDLTTLLAAISSARPRGRRHGLIAAGIAAAVGIAAWSTRAKTEDPCADGARRVDELWTDARRAEVQQALARHDNPRARESAPLVVAHFDQYATRWSTAYAGACSSGRTRDAGASATFDEVSVCLEQRLGQLGLRLDALDDASVRLAERAIDIARSLPSVDACTEPSEIQRRRKLAPPPEDRDAVDAIRAERDRLDLRFRSGERATVFEEIEQLVPRAEALGNRVLLAELLAFRGRARRSSANPEKSDADIRLAIEHAIAVGDDGQVASLASSLAYGFDHVGDTTESLYWVSLAEAFAERGDLRDADKAIITRGRGELTAQAGQVSQGVGILEALVERLTVQPLNDGDVQLARAKIALGRGLNLRGDGDEAIELFRQARDRLVEQLGLHHPLSVQPLYYEGNALAALGRTAEALDALTKYRQHAVEAGTWASFQELGWRLNVGSAHFTGKDYDAALGVMKPALQQIDDGAKAHPMVHVQLLRITGQANAKLGRLDDAAAAFDAARVIAEADLPTAAGEHVSLAARSARILMRRGQFEAAIEALEAALQRAQKQASNRSRLPDAFLAETLWRAEVDDKRAASLAKEALSEKGRRTLPVDLVAQLEAWLQTPPRGVPSPSASR